MTRTVTLDSEQATIVIEALECLARSIPRGNPSPTTEAANRRKRAMALDLAIAVRIA